MAAIPEDKRIQKKIKPLIMLSDPGSPVAEAFRSLRASLALQDFSSYNSNDKGSSSRSILITSSLPGEGKSFVSANLAVAYASQLNMKTLLIEADLRRPVIDRIFGLKTPGAGTVGALNDLEKWETAVVESGIPNLDLLTGGEHATDRPAELLGSIRMNHLLEKAVERYDRVVIDSPPVNSVSDALLFGSEVDNALLVADANRTPASSVKRAKTQLAGSVREISGLVLNRMPQKPGSVADPYHFYYMANDAYGESYNRKVES
jgi:capsular exopolysaccharide synthesis family protein